MLGGGRGPGASGGQGRAVAAGHRQRIHADRWLEAPALRHRSRELRGSHATDHARSAQREKGSYTLTRADVAEYGQRCLALWTPATSRDPPPLADAHWLTATFPGRGWIAVELFARSGDRARLAYLESVAHASGLPLVAAGDVHMHVRARRALQDTLTAVRVKKPVAECGYALYPNGERHLRSRARLATLYPHELLAETLSLAARCTFSLDELRYSIRKSSCRPARRRARICGNWWKRD